MSIADDLADLSSKIGEASQGADSLESALDYKIQDLEVMKNDIGGVVSDLQDNLAALDNLRENVEQYEELKSLINDEGIYGE